MLFQLSDLKIVLIVGLHTAMTCLATGDMKKAVLYSTVVGACYFIIVGTVWTGRRERAINPH